MPNRTTTEFVIAISDCIDIFNPISRSRLLINRA